MVDLSEHALSVIFDAHHRSRFLSKRQPVLPTRSVTGLAATAAPTSSYTSDGQPRLWPTYPRSEPMKLRYKILGAIAIVLAVAATALGLAMSHTPACGPVPSPE